MKLLLLVILLALIPSALAQSGTTTEPVSDIVVLAEATNQRVDLIWYSTTLPAGTVAKYRVYVFEDGREFTNRTIENATHATFFLTNGRTYAFQVAHIKPDGTEGPRSNPVAATPRLENDLAYLAAGLIAVWVGLFGYAAFLARKEASIDAKLERILQARFQGRAP